MTYRDPAPRDLAEVRHVELRHLLHDASVSQAQMYRQIVDLETRLTRRVTTTLRVVALLSLVNVVIVWLALLLLVLVRR